MHKHLIAHVHVPAHTLTKKKSHTHLIANKAYTNSWCSQTPVCNTTLWFCSGEKKKLDKTAMPEWFFSRLSRPGAHCQLLKTAREWTRKEEWTNRGTNRDREADSRTDCTVAWEKMQKQCGLACKSGSHVDARSRPKVFRSCNLPAFTSH